MPMCPPEPGPILLSRRMSERQISQRQLEKTLGLSQGIVSRWLHGQRTPGLRAAIAIETLLDIPVTSWTCSAAAASTD